MWELVFVSMFIGALFGFIIYMINSLQSPHYTEGSKDWKHRIRHEGSMTDILVEKYPFLSYLEASIYAEKWYDKKYGKDTGRD
jgi:hypothetical protein